ncbi:PIN domain-containing protein [Patescibacteria group bacterium]|nr:PIN domain-containing protein [Patescibacteria group bacterium]
MDILDSSALICLLKKEPGHVQVSALLKKSGNSKQTVFICQINFTEVVYFLFKKYGEEKALKTIAGLRSPFLGISNYMDADLAFYAATLKAGYDLSLGDAMGLAFTKIMDGVFWTRDKDLAPIAGKEGISLRLLV